MRRSWVLIAGIVACLIVGAIGWSWRSGPASAFAVDAAEPVADEERAIVEPPAPLAGATAERWSASADVAEATVPTVATVPIPEPAGPSLDELVAELQALWASRSEAFHAEAPARLLAFASATSLPAEDLQAAVDTELLRADLEEPVRGALVALRGSAALESMMLPGAGSVAREEWRGARLGLAADWPGGGGARGLRIDLREEPLLASSLSGHVRDLLMLPLARIVPERQREQLVGELFHVADDLDGVTDRWLSIYALGPAVETDPALVDLLVELLFDDSPLGRQVHKPILFVLTRSRRPELLDLVQRYLREGPEGAVAKDLARLWLAPAVELERLLEPIGPDLAPMDAMFALGALDAWMSEVRSSGRGLTEHEERRIVEVTARTLDDAEDSSLRMVAISILAFSTSRGSERVATLRDVFEHDPVARNRKFAVQGLGKTVDPWRAEALAVLRARRSPETDEQVAKEIEKVLSG